MSIGRCPGRDGEILNADEMAKAKPPAEPQPPPRVQLPLACEANGCKTPPLPRRPIPGSAAGEATPWVVTTIPPGWCVRIAENIDVGTSRLVVLCPLHSAGVVKPEPTRVVWCNPGARVDEIRAELERDHGPAARIAELEAEVFMLRGRLAVADDLLEDLPAGVEVSPAWVDAVRGALAGVASRVYGAT